MLLIQYYDEILHCEEPARSKIQVYTDSRSMVKKLKAYDEHPTASLAAVLDSEWDVLSALSIALKAGSGWICKRCFQFITVAHGRWKIIKS
jgi:hypothetical protein